MVLLERIELSASPLPRVCSTTELQQRIHRVRPPAVGPVRGAGAPYSAALSCQAETLPARPPAMAEEVRSSREERLAAKLRENLRRRKVQSRELAAQNANLSKPADES